MLDHEENHMPSSFAPDRRSFLRRLGIAGVASAAGAALGSILGPRFARAQPARPGSKQLASQPSAAAPVRPSSNTDRDVVLRANDFPSLQAAVDACPPFGTVLLSARQYDLTAPLLLPLDRPLTLQGQGAWDGEPRKSPIGTLLVAIGDTDGIHVRGFGQRISNLRLSGDGKIPSRPNRSGRGIYIGRRAADAAIDPRALRDIRIEDVVIADTRSWGLCVGGVGSYPDGTKEEDPLAESTLSYWVNFERVWCRGQYQGGGAFVGLGSTTVRFDGCKMTDQRGYFAYSAGLQTTFENCTFETDVGARRVPWVELAADSGHALRSCWWEMHHGDQQPFLVVSGSAAAVLDSPRFVRPGPPGAPHAVARAGARLMAQGCPELTEWVSRGLMRGVQTR
jgi:hypothetical protein